MGVVRVVIAEGRVIVALGVAAGARRGRALPEMPLTVILDAQDQLGCLTMYHYEARGGDWPMNVAAVFIVFCWKKLWWRDAGFRQRHLLDLFPGQLL